MSRLRLSILTTNTATVTIALLGLAIGVLPFLASGGWIRVIALVGVALAAGCMVAVNWPAFARLAGPQRSIRQVTVPAVSLLFLVALGLAVTVDVPAQIRVSRASEQEVLEHFDIEGMERTSTRTILRSYYCDIVQVVAHADIAGVRTEQAWTRKHYPGFKFHSQALAAHKRFLRPGNPYSDVITITTAEGHRKTLIFDISSSFMAKDGQRDYAQYFRDNRRQLCP